MTNKHHPRASVTTMLQDLKWPPLDLRRREHRLCMMFKIVKGEVAIRAADHLTKADKCKRSNHRVTIPISSAILPPIVNNTGTHTFHEQYLSGTYYPSQSSQRTLPHISWLACTLPHKCCVLPPLLLYSLPRSRQVLIQIQIMYANIEKPAHTSDYFWYLAVFIYGYLAIVNWYLFFLSYGKWW